MKFNFKKAIFCLVAMLPFCVGGQVCDWSVFDDLNMPHSTIGDDVAASECESQSFILADDCLYMYAHWMFHAGSAHYVRYEQRSDTLFIHHGDKTCTSVRAMYDLNLVLSNRELDNYVVVSSVSDCSGEQKADTLIVSKTIQADSGQLVGICWVNKDTIQVPPYYSDADRYRRIDIADNRLTYDAIETMCVGGLRYYFYEESSDTLFIMHGDDVYTSSNGIGNYKVHFEVDGCLQDQYTVVFFAGGNGRDTSHSPSYWWYRYHQSPNYSDNDNLILQIANNHLPDCDFIHQFSLDITDVISMYADDKAFYLHTENVMYVVSREGEMLSSESSKVKYGCFENGVLYTHTETDDCILTQQGDVLLQVVPGESNQARMLGARCMCIKDGVFYWHIGHRDNGGRSDCFYQVTKDGAYTHLGYWDGIVRGLVKTDDGLLLLTSTDLSFIPQDIVENQCISQSVINENSLPLPDLKFVGLVLNENGAYAWSNADHRMYLIPQSFLMQMVTSICLPLEADGYPLFYDLLGRPTSHPTRGIYIQNGRKVWVE